MTKRKTKLVCVGWGIWEIDGKCLWCDADNIIWKKRKYAIEAWDSWYGENSYRGNRQRGLAIAKKLWVKVKETDE